MKRQGGRPATYSTTPFAAVAVIPGKTLAVRRMTVASQLRPVPFKHLPHSGPGLIGFRVELFVLFGRNRDRKMILGYIVLRKHADLDLRSVGPNNPIHCSFQRSPQCSDRGCEFVSLFRGIAFG